MLPPCAACCWRCHRQLYVSADATTFDAFGRVMSGTVKVGQQVRVLGEGYTPDDEEDVTLQTVTDVWMFNTRYASRGSRAARWVGRCRWLRLTQYWNGARSGCVYVVYAVHVRVCVRVRGRRGAVTAATA